MRALHSKLLCAFTEPANELPPRLWGDRFECQSACETLVCSPTTRPFPLPAFRGGSSEEELYGLCSTLYTRHCCQATRRERASLLDGMMVLFVSVCDENWIESSSNQMDVPIRIELKGGAISAAHFD